MEAGSSKPAIVAVTLAAGKPVVPAVAVDGRAAQADGTKVGSFFPVDPFKHISKEK